MPSERKTKTTAPRRARTKNVTAAVAAPEPIPDVAEVLEEPVAEVQEEVPVSVPITSRRRKLPTKEEVSQDFDRVLDSIQAQMDARRANKSHNVTLKTLKALISDVKRLRTNALRIARKTSNRVVDPSKNALSGFKKPVAVSKGMLKFTGWDASQNYSRNDVTQFICNYIKENNLQNPEDRRKILPDKKLAKLLGYDAKDEEPLTYFRIQKLVQPHFI